MANKINKSSLCWFRRDLRLNDHAALYHALKHSQVVHCVFVFDTEILDALVNKKDRRVEFIWYCVKALQEQLVARGSTLHVLYGKATECISALAKELAVDAVYCNRDYEPAAIQRDQQVADTLGDDAIAFHSFKDQVIFEQSEVLNGAGKPFAVFTPYKNAWLRKLNDFYLRAYPVTQYLSALAPAINQGMPSFEVLGFETGCLSLEKTIPGETGAAQLLSDFMTRIHRYHEGRNFPAVKGVSYLSTHIRFGTVSIRQLAAQAFYTGGIGAETWLSELIWRDFYQMLLHHNPQLAEGHAFKSTFNALRFTNNKHLFDAWRGAQTGYPLIDAAMRQLNQTGYMHNRLRMIVASFLVKDLHVDWRAGERYFAEHLLDFDFSANNGGWQWCASTGCDAQPWFRIFNPVTQSEKFDSTGKFIRRYIPELTQCPDKWIHAPWRMPSAVQEDCGIFIGQHYPQPIVDHSAARLMTLEIYKNA